LTAKRRDGIATTVYNTGSAIYNPQLPNALLSSPNQCLPVSQLTDREEMTWKADKKAEVFNMKGCINHVGSPKRTLQAAVEVLPQP